MATRRQFLHALGWAAGASRFTETAFAQRALVGANWPPDTVWLNANENPEGPCPSAIEAMTRVLPEAGRYHYQEFRDFYAAVAKSEGLDGEQVLIGSGSSEVLHAAIDAFTAPARPLITMDPTYEGPVAVTMAYERPVVRVALTEKYGADVKRLVEEAAKARGGLIYLCNPNNPTASVTPKQDLAWLVANLPPDTLVLIDEAYIHFSESPELESALKYVREGKNVIVTRTFSKIYGMAGLRAGFACARPDLIRKMEPFRSNVISIVTVRAVLASLADAPKILPDRRARLIATRNELCEWLRTKNLRYIEPHANFIMIELGRDVRDVIPRMIEKGVAVGRPFPPLTNMLRVSIGTPGDMQKFRRVFWEVYSA